MFQQNNSVGMGSTTAVNEGLRAHMVRVYNYMTGGLLITAIMAFIFSQPPFANMLFSPTGGMTGFGMLVSFSPLLMIFGFGWVLKRGSLAQVQGTFWGFAALMGMSLSYIFLAYTGASITRVFLITSAMFGGMSIYGYTTKKDLTNMGSFLIMALIGVIVASIVNIFLRSSGMEFILSLLSVLIFTGLTAYDTQKIAQMYQYAGNHDSATRIAVSGALSLYMDFINMFIHLLRFFGDRR